jgi:hypothetical protein
MFSDLFPAFVELWSQPCWKDQLRKVVYWYVNANTTGGGVNVDSGLLFTQAALELLAWTYCVNDKKVVSEKPFGPRGGLSAMDKLSLLVGLLGLPLDIPKGLSALHGRRGRKYRNSMDAITDLRNGLVHPTGSGSVAHNSYLEAWMLSLWYVEVVILKLCNYSGKYSNRLVERHVGEVESLP